MKNVFYILAILCPVLLFGQTTTENYIKTTTYQVETTSGSVTDDEKIQSVTYFDGLGRPKQSVVKQGGGDKEDIITPVVYDLMGRQAKSYLPYARSTSSLNYELPANLMPNLETFYDTKYPSEWGSGDVINIYSEKLFDDTPLSRIQEQGAPGKDWLGDDSVDTDHTIKFEYLTNAASEVKKFVVNFVDDNKELPELTFEGFYPANELYKTITKDENWQPGQTYTKDHTVEEFKDIEGRVILKRTYNEDSPHDTQYVYDDYGNLTYVIPPLSSDLLVTENNYTNFTDNITVPTNWSGDITVSLSGYDLTLDIDVSYNGIGGTFPIGAMQQLSQPIPDIDFMTTFTYHSFVISNEFLTVKPKGTPFPPPISSLVGIFTVQVPQYTIEQDILDKLCYQYRYDKRNRLIGKKIPAKDWEYIIYNRLDQPVLTQDGNLRPYDKWLFTKYDRMGRVVYTGMFRHMPEVPPGNIPYDGEYKRVATQTLANSYSTLFESSGNEAIDGINTYYTNDAFPTTDTGSFPKYEILEIYTINYYDDYNFDLSGFTAPSTVYGVTPTTNVKGLATGSKVKVLDVSPNKWITTVSYFDDEGMLIYSGSENEYLDTTDLIEIDLDFTGKTLETKTTHTKGTNPSIIVTDDFDFDHVGRLLKQVQTITGESPQLIAKNTYDELGQLESKAVGNTVTTPLQNIDYTYNIRGWLKEINDITSLGTDLFSFKINYNTQDHGATELYNGNISETIWRTINDGISDGPGKGDGTSDGRGYVYDYDPLNRFTQGTSFIINGSKISSSAQAINFTSKVSGYDKNGNIMALKRPGTDDLLIYSYDANQLLSVTDTSGNSSDGFIDGNTTGDDYSYDSNGNMTKDLNKGIGSISYNHLNLPTHVDFGSGDEIEYIYDASGVKLTKMVTDNGTSTTTKYAGNYVYQETTSGEVLKFFSHQEGYVEPDGSSYDYVFQYKDHLGNIRLSYKNIGSASTPNLEVLEENNYFPFGLKHKGYNSIVNSTNTALKFKYNGKELDESLGLNMYEMDMRQYDPAIARWTVIDPVTHFNISTYASFDNNPIYYADPSGATTVSSIQEAWDATPENGSTTWLMDGNGNLCDDCNVKEGQVRGVPGAIIGQDGPITKIEYYHSGGLNGSEGVWLSENDYFNLFRNKVRDVALGRSSIDWLNNYDFTDDMLIALSLWIDQATDYYSSHYPPETGIGNITALSFLDFVPGKISFKGIQKLINSGKFAFYSGKNTSNVAKMKGFISLNRTRAGVNLNNMTRSMEYAPGTQAYKYWQRLSAAYARKVRPGSTANVFITKKAASDPESIWNTIEKPILLNNNVTIKYNWVKD